MKRKDSLDKSTNIMIKLFIISALFFPIVTTEAVNPELDGYYSRFILDNLFAFGIIVIAFAGMIVKNEVQKEHIKGIVLLTIPLILYTFFYCINYRNIQFEWGLVNTLISCCLFLVLFMRKTKNLFEKGKIISFTMVTIIVSNLLGLIFYIKGFLSVHMYNFQLTLVPMNPDYYEKRFNWIYFYKCQYSFMLMLFVAFFVANRKKIKHISLYVLSLLILFTCLYVAHTNTSLVCAMLIVAADILDSILKRKEKIILKLLPIAVVLSMITKYLFDKISKERDLSSIGGRKNIWSASIKKIINNPNGLGNKFILDTNEWIQVMDGWKVNNCHNVFLNEMLRYSIFVGSSYFLFYVVMCIYSLVRKFTFSRLMTWLGIFVATSMDYSVQTPELAMTMFMFYCIFFYPLEQEK